MHVYLKAVVEQDQVLRNMPTAPSISLLLTPHLAHWPAENPARQLVAAAAAFTLRIVQTCQLEGESALAGAEFLPLSDDAPGALVRVGIAPADAAAKGRAAWDPQPRCCTGIIAPFPPGGSASTTAFYANAYRVAKAMTASPGLSRPRFLRWQGRPWNLSRAPCA